MCLICYLLALSSLCSEWKSPKYRPVTFSLFRLCVLIVPHFILAHRIVAASQLLRGLQEMPLRSDLRSL